MYRLANVSQIRTIMKTILKRLAPICLIAPFLYIGAAAAQSKEQQEMEQMLEMMKASGVPQQQIDQVENMLKGMVEMEAKQKEAEANKEQEQFASQTVGFGTAVVEAEGRSYQLTVTKCEVRDQSKGVVTILGRQAPGLEGAELSIHSSGNYSASSISFSTRAKPRKNYHTQKPEFEFGDNKLSWQGAVQSDSGNEVPFSLNLECGEEAVFYDTATKATASLSESSAVLYLGDETYQFDAGRCHQEEYRTGNLIVEFEVTATGNFRGRPAVLLMTKSRGAPGSEGEGAGPFHDFELLLSEVTADQRNLSPLELKPKLRENAESFRNQQMAMHQEKYNEEFWATVAPENFSEAIEKSSSEMDALMEEADAMVVPVALSRGGTISIDGQKAIFRGPAMQSSDADRAPQFNNLDQLEPEAHALCGG